MRRVNERMAQINGALINHYFGGKRGLYEACVDEVYRRLGVRAKEAMAGEILANDPRGGAKR